MIIKKVKIILLWIVATMALLPLPTEAQPVTEAKPVAEAQPVAEAKPIVGPASPNLAGATEAYGRGNYIASLEQLWLAQEFIWDQAPLAVRNVHFITGQPTNFATYQPRIGEEFKSPEPLILYGEPISFTQLKERGTYRYSLSATFDILDAEGTVLGSQKLKPYTQSNYRTFSTETMLTMTIGIQGLPMGSYTLRVTLTDDLNPNKTAQVEKPFSIVD